MCGRTDWKSGEMRPGGQGGCYRSGGGPMSWARAEDGEENGDGEKIISRLMGKGSGKRWGKRLEA